ncbi:phage tail assembly chaperone [Parablautia sp. Marseille-Q6255]|uniref:phage tail assembly chaperone n=1 Tax=Parablautia sp. Marseille-Q6255 TaxID=3039593 RepID=UPI0024BBEF47|nr:hypothetical protein [Parablautia sp. Marseille-Q6255]
MDMKAFMKSDLKDRGTIEFKGIDRFLDDKGKPIPFILRRLSRNRVQEIRNLYRTKDVFYDTSSGSKRPLLTADGQVATIVNYDADKVSTHIMIESFVQPKLDDKELMEYYGVLDRMDMPAILFPDRAEYDYANKCVMIACGMSEDKDEKVIDDLKN